MTTRRDSTRATRQRIVEAALGLFSDPGVLATRIEDVAALAGVGRSTVFTHFAAKPDLLRAVEEEAAVRAGVPALIGRVAVLGPVDALREVVIGGTAVWSAERALFRQFYAHARVDPELAAMVVEKERARSGIVGLSIDRVADEVGLAPGWSRGDATTATAALTGFETADRLLGDHPAARAGEILWRLVATVVRRRRTELLDVVRPLPADVVFVPRRDPATFGAVRQGLFLLSDGVWWVALDLPPGPTKQPGTRIERWVDRAGIRSIEVDGRTIRLEADPTPLEVTVDAEDRAEVERALRGWLAATE